MNRLLILCATAAFALLLAGPVRAQEPVDQVAKSFCLSALGYSTIDGLQQDLLLNAKRAAVDELFGELISGSQVVEELIVTRDEIRSTSLGFVRVEGSPIYANGENLADVCITLNAYATDADRAQFEPVPLSKRYCEGDPNLTTSEIQERAKLNAVVQALFEYDPRLEDVPPGTVRRLMQRITYTESGFVPETGTYCTTVSGEVKPVYVLAVLGGAELLPATEAPAATAGAVKSEARELPAVSAASSKGTPLPFSVDGKTLAPEWTFVPGDADFGEYVIAKNGGLRLVTGNECTDRDNADELRSTRVALPLEGDFAVQVRVGFEPAGTYQSAGLFLSGREDLSTRIGLLRKYDYYGDGHWLIPQTVIGDEETLLSGLQYDRPSAYLEIARSGDDFTISASESGANWVPLVEEYSFPLPDEVLLWLFAYNFCEEKPTGADFSELTLLEGLPARVLARGELPELSDPQGDGSLPAYWQWLPGASGQSTARARDGKLAVVAGPETRWWEGYRTAPRVRTLVSGDFVVQVELDSAVDNGRFAGIILTAPNDSSHWVGLRKGYDWNGEGLSAAAGYQGSSEVSAFVKVAEEHVVLRMRREGPFLTMEYSLDGETWEIVAADLVTSLPDDVYLTLYASSESNQGHSATFSNLVMERQ